MEMYRNLVNVKSVAGTSGLEKKTVGFNLGRIRIEGVWKKK